MLAHHGSCTRQQEQYMQTNCQDFKVLEDTDPKDLKLECGAQKSAEPFQETANLKIK